MAASGRGGTRPEGEEAGMSDLGGNQERPRATVCERCGNAVATHIRLYVSPGGEPYDFWLCESCAAKSGGKEKEAGMSGP